MSLIVVTLFKKIKLHCAKGSDVPVTGPSGASILLIRCVVINNTDTAIRKKEIGFFRISSNSVANLVDPAA